jgi:hypothetical protein
MSDEEGKEVHPIVKKALNLAHSGKEPVEFTDEAIDELIESIKQYFGKKELFKAVVDLINLAGILEEQGSLKASIQLMIVVSTCANELEKLNKKRNSRGVQGAKASRPSSPDQ